MAKKEKKSARLSEILSIFLWFVGIIVSVSVGSGMIQGVLKIPGIPLIVTEVAGWSVVVVSIFSVILAVFSRQ